MGERVVKLAAVFLLGLLAGLLLSPHASAPRPRQQDVPPAAGTGAPIDPVVAQHVEHPSDLLSDEEASGANPGHGANVGVPTPSATGTRPAPTGRPATARPSQAPRPTGRIGTPLTSSPLRSASGAATWYRWRPGEAAAGPALRAALGPSWRGRVVLVEGIPVRLTDWCACRGRAIDLDYRTFSRLAPLSRGVVEVEITW